jgi:hypothetical protein
MFNCDAAVELDYARYNNLHDVLNVEAVIRDPMTLQVLDTPIRPGLSMNRILPPARRSSAQNSTRRKLQERSSLLKFSST